MTTVQQVYEGMQRLAPPELAEHWDKSDRSHVVL